MVFSPPNVVSINRYAAEVIAERNYKLSFCSHELLDYSYIPFQKSLIAFVYLEQFD